MTKFIIFKLLEIRNWKLEINFNIPSFNNKINLFSLLIYDLCDNYEI
jgi:hypothetical protein